ncbi:hypothetical protein BC833DRAFT_662908 [Globomyces pollinis-pini]|nr:hypothetical protein BC833DRAFT_662908 [Globomyces pollinis-pini]
MEGRYLEVNNIEFGKLKKYSKFYQHVLNFAKTNTTLTPDNNNLVRIPHKFKHNGKIYRTTSLDIEGSLNNAVADLDDAYGSIKNKTGYKYGQFLVEWITLKRYVNGLQVTYPGGMQGFYVNEKLKSHAELYEPVDSNDKIEETSSLKKRYLKQFQAMKTMYCRLKRVEDLRRRCDFGKYFFHCALPFTDLFNADIDSLARQMKEHSQYQLCKHSTHSREWQKGTQLDEILDIDTDYSSSEEDSD